MNHNKAIRYNTIPKNETVDLQEIEENDYKCYLEKKLNVSTTENGATGYKTTYHPIVDLNFLTSSLRNMDEKDIVNKFIDAYIDDRENTIKWLFFLRDIKEGLGERRSFRIMLKYLAETRSDLAKKLIPYISEYGRFDDYLILLDTCICDDVVKYIKDVLDKDLLNVKNDKPITLLAKWLPSINTSSKETKRYAKKLIKKMNMSEREYRKILSKLRSYSNVLEVKLTENKWEDVNYENVPSKANMKYDDAFLRHDNDRRIKYLEDALNGDKNINFKTLMPYEITKKIVDNNFKDSVISELMWKKITNEGFDNKWGFDDCIVVADGSGSMYSCVDINAKTKAIDVCNAIAIYFASKLKGVYKDKAITFSMNPRFIDMSLCKNLREKLEKIYSYHECANTNIKAVFNMILELAKDKKVPKEEIPKQILIISDMEFDSCTSYNTKNVKEKLFDVISKEYEEAGYKLPKLIFWNVCGRTETIPMIDNEEGLSLISGFSQNAIKIASNKEKKNPYDSLVDILNVPRYNVIWDAVKEVA